MREACDVKDLTFPPKTIVAVAMKALLCWFDLGATGGFFYLVGIYTNISFRR
jgi:hypothetical protein